MMPNAESKQAATSRTGTCVNFSRAIVDSTTPTATATSSIPATKDRPIEPGVPASNGSARRTTKAPKTNSLSAAP